MNCLLCDLEASDGGLPLSRFRAKNPIHTDNIIFFDNIIRSMDDMDADGPAVAKNNELERQRKVAA